MNRRVFVRVTGQRIVLLPHAIERYAERGCRHDDLYLATDELVLLLTRHGHITTDRPGWVHESDNARRTDAWLLLGDDIAFPLEQPKPWLLAAMTARSAAGWATPALNGPRRSRWMIERGRTAATAAVAAQSGTTFAPMATAGSASTAPPVRPGRCSLRPSRSRKSPHTLRAGSQATMSRPHQKHPLSLSHYHDEDRIRRSFAERDEDRSRSGQPDTPTCTCPRCTRQVIWSALGCCYACICGWSSNG